MSQGKSIEMKLYESNARYAAYDIKKKLRNSQMLKVITVWDLQIMVSDSVPDPDYEIVGYYQGTSIKVDDLADDIRAARKVLRARARVGQVAA